MNDWRTVVLLPNGQEVVINDTLDTVVSILHMGISCFLETSFQNH